MFSLFLHCAPDEEDQLIADLWEQATTGIAEEPGGMRAFFNDETRMPQVLAHFAGFAPDPRIESEVDWEQFSRDAWAPISVGDRFFLAPPWWGEPGPAGRLRLEIYPGMACGTGRHPATQLCLQAMEQFVWPGSTVVDVGTGSGILSAAAWLLGAASVVACDTDPESVEIARSRVAADFFIGSLEAIQSEVADVIIANIDSATIERLRPEFERVRRHGVRTVLILSGFPEWDRPRGFDPAQTLQLEEWICLIHRGQAPVK